MIVADTCIIVYLFNESEFTEAASELFDKEPNWIIPTLWKEEYANVILKQAKQLKVKDSVVLNNLKITMEALQSVETYVSVYNALEVALKYDISVYDAHFLALAIENKIKLVTEDRELIKKCPKIAFSIKEYLKA